MAQTKDTPMKPAWTISEDLKTVTLTVSTEPPIVLKWTVAGVDDILKNLGELRASMPPEFPRGYDRGQKVSNCVPDPIWVTEPDAMMGNSLLHIRDPRYGWLHYLLPRDEAKKLGGYLQQQADEPPPGQHTGKAN